MINLHFLQNCEGQKVKRMSKIYVYVCKWDYSSVKGVQESALVNVVIFLRKSLNMGPIFEKKKKIPHENTVKAQSLHGWSIAGRALN